MLKKIADYKVICKPIAPENSIGRISRMDAINNKILAEAALRLAESKMQQIQAMQHITLDRLMILPHSNFFVNCAQ